MNVLVTVCLTDAEAAALLPMQSSDLGRVRDDHRARDRANALGKVAAARWMAQMRNAAEVDGVKARSPSVQPIPGATVRAAVVLESYVIGENGSMAVKNPQRTSKT